MKQTTMLGALALALSLAAGTAAAQDAATTTAQAGATDAMTSPQVRAALTGAGYTDIDDLEFEDGVWKADVTDAAGSRIDVRMDPATGRIYPDNAGATSLGEADIRAQLTAGGYTRIDDVKFDDGIWQAEADNAQGQRMDLKIDPQDGRVISETRD